MFWIYFLLIFITVLTIWNSIIFALIAIFLVRKHEESQQELLPVSPPKPTTGLIDITTPQV